MDYDISEAFEAIENELIDSMMRNFKRHRAEETKEGYNWTAWQAEQLNSLEQYRKRNTKKFRKKFSAINDKVAEMLEVAREDGNARQEKKILEAVRKGFSLPDKPSKTSTAKFFKTNDRKLNALIKSTTDDLKTAETAVLRMSNDKYRKIIYNAQVYANTGAGTYEKAVDMACHDFLRAGINCIEYSNGARHTMSDYAEMAIRTANKRAYLCGEGEKRKEFGITTVVVNSRQGGCPNCAKYIGKIFIDDVYSGGKSSDGNYPLLSNAIAGGLFHPRCKDSTSTYYEGITTLKPVTPEEQKEMERREALENRASYCKNEGKKCQRIAKHSLDEDKKREYQQRAKAWEEKSQQVAENIDKTVEKSAESGIIKSGAISGALNPDSKKAQEHAAQYYAAVRKMRNDYKRIAINTNIPEAEIKAVKEFIFTTKHDLGNGKLEYFVPSFDMAESWRRLIEGKEIQPHDITLLKHEIMEKELMRQGMTQNEAHRIASKKYNYAKEAKAYYDRTKKNKKG